MAGMAMYSAKQPSRSTPMMRVCGQTCELPVRQSRQRPQTMCPSAVTRSPTCTSVTSAPDLDDVAGELVADHEGGLAASARPVVPFVDVHVGAADAGAAHLDEHFVVPDLRAGDVRQLESGSAGRLHESLHGVDAGMQSGGAAARSR